MALELKVPLFLLGITDRAHIGAEKQEKLLKLTLRLQAHSLSLSFIASWSWLVAAGSIFSHKNHCTSMLAL